MYLECHAPEKQLYLKLKGFSLKNRSNQMQEVGEECCVHPAHAILAGSSGTTLITDILVDQHVWDGTRERKAG